LARRCRCERLARAITAGPAPVPARGGWRGNVLRVALGTHLALAIYSAVLVARFGPVDFSENPDGPWHQVFRNFRSANTYTPYATFTPERVGVEFLGSNDAGVTWRSFDYHEFPQAPDRICGFIAPRFLRFEATMQVIATLPTRTSTFPLIALK